MSLTSYPGPYWLMLSHSLYVTLISDDFDLPLGSPRPRLVLRSDAVSDARRYDGTTRTHGISDEMKHTNDMLVSTMTSKNKTTTMKPGMDIQAIFVPSYRLDSCKSVARSWRFHVSFVIRVTLMNSEYL